jgi:sulfite exporter TauE/SafE
MGPLMSSLIPQVSNPYIGALLGGLIYGLAVCTASCLPYLAGYIAGVGAGFRRGVSVTLIFSGGRIVGYAIVGALVGLFGGLFQIIISKNEIAPFQIYSSFVFGAITIGIGAYVLYRVKYPKCDCKPQESKKLAVLAKKSRFGLDFGAFTLGLSRGLILCPPMMALLFLYALPFASPVGSVALAVLFGLGTTISPILLLGGVTGWLLNKAPLLKTWVSIGGSVILILLGTVTVINSLIQL